MSSYYVLTEMFVRRLKMEKFILPSRLVVFVFIILSVLSSLIIKKNSLNRLFMMVFVYFCYLFVSFPRWGFGDKNEKFS